MGEKHVILEHVAERSLLWRDRDPLLAIEIDDVIERDMAFFRMEQACQQAQDGTFPAPALSQQYQRLPFLNLEIHGQVKGIKMGLQRNVQHSSPVVIY